MLVKINKKYINRKYYLHKKKKIKTTKFSGLTTTLKNFPKPIFLYV